MAAADQVCDAPARNEAKSALGRISEDLTFDEFAMASEAKTRTAVLKPSISVSHLTMKRHERRRSLSSDPTDSVNDDNKLHESAPLLARPWLRALVTPIQSLEDQARALNQLPALKGRVQLKSLR